MTKRGSFSEREIWILRQLIHENEHIIESRKTDVTSMCMKKSVWMEITRIFNSHEFVRQSTVKQLKKCWDNLKTRAKAKAVEEKRERSCTCTERVITTTDAQVQTDVPTDDHAHSHPLENSAEICRPAHSCTFKEGSEIDGPAYKYMYPLYNRLDIEGPAHIRPLKNSLEIDMGVDVPDLHGGAPIKTEVADDTDWQVYAAVADPLNSRFDADSRPIATEKTVFTDNDNATRPTGQLGYTPDCAHVNAVQQTILERHERQEHDVRMAMLKRKLEREEEKHAMKMKYLRTKLEIMEQSTRNTYITTPASTPYTKPQDFGPLKYASFCRGQNGCPWI